MHAAHRARAARRYAGYNFLKERAAEDIADRLEAIPRQFTRVLDLGSHDGEVSAALGARPHLMARMGDMVRCDLSPAFMQRPSGLVLAADEEWLPFKPHSFNAVFSALSLHWVNDLPGALIQIRNVLTPDGLFIGQMLGGATLHELRACLIDAETEIRGGAGMRVSPFADLTDMSALMQRAGFVMPVADTDTIRVRYAHPLKLLEDLRGMGETSCPAHNNAPPLTRAILMRMAQLYMERHADADGKVTATFDILSVSGWAPGPGQPKPLRPGSAKARLADALGVPEKSAGEKTGN